MRILFEADQIPVDWKIAGWLKFYAYNDAQQNMMVKQYIIWLNQYQIIAEPPYSNFDAVFDPLERIKWFTIYFWRLIQLI